MSRDTLDSTCFLYYYSAGTMKLSDTDLSHADREWAERVLKQDEELLLALRRQARLFHEGRLQPALIGLFFVVFCVVGLTQSAGSPSLANILIPGIMLLVGLALLVNPWWTYTLERREFFLVTSRRVIHFSFSSIRRAPMEVSYELRPNVQLEVVGFSKDGSGSLAFNYEDEEEAMEYGGLLEDIPEVRRVESLLRASLSGQPVR